VSARKFLVFISYSHAADGRLAPALQSGLQRFAKPWYRLRAMRVFRDKTGLAVTPDLWGAIQNGLENSDYFLLLASPQAAQSKWVEQEVDWWLQNRSTNQLLIVWTEGELVWSRTAADFDWTATNALTEGLKKTFEREPLFLDMRWARSDSDLSLRHPKFAEAVAGLAATLHGKSVDELLWEDKKAMRLLQFALLAVLGLTFAALFATFNAKQAKDLAKGLRSEQQTNAMVHANQELSRKLAEIALNQQSSDQELSILLAAEAVRIEPTDEARSALRQTLFASLEPVLTVRGHRERECYATFSPDGTKLLTWGDETAQIHDAITGKVLQELRGHTNDILQASFSSDGRRICTASEDDSVRLWDALTGGSLVALPHHGVNAALISPDGTRVVTLAMGDNALLWEAATGTKLAELDYSENVIYADQIRDVAFHPDGGRVAKCALRDPVVHDAKTGKLLFELEGHTKAVSSIKYSPDGNWLITASEDGTVRRWRASTGKAENTLQHDSGLFDAQFSPDGKWVAARDTDSILHVWEADSGKKVADIEIRPKPEGPVIFTFSPDGECLLVASFDASTAQLWETRTGARLAELRGQEGEIRTIHFSPDGKRIVVGSIFAPARIYATGMSGSLKDLLALARSRVARELTPAERQKYLPAARNR
jgi:WD40 repeat protein